MQRTDGLAETPTGLLVPEGYILKDDPTPQPQYSNRTLGDYWKARYEALAARIADDKYITNSATLVYSAALISQGTGQSFRQVFQALLQKVSKDQRQAQARHAQAQQPRKTKPRK